MNAIGAYKLTRTSIDRMLAELRCKLRLAVPLSHQSLRCQIEYRIIGVNSAGISVPSNTAAVVL